MLKKIVKAWAKRKVEKLQEAPTPDPAPAPTVEGQDKALAFCAEAIKEAEVADSSAGEECLPEGPLVIEHSALCVCNACTALDTDAVKQATQSDLKGVNDMSEKDLWWEKENYGTGPGSAWAEGEHYNGVGYVSSKGSSYKGKYKPRKICTHKATEPAFRINRCDVYGGQGLYQYGLDEFSLWLDCGDHARTRPLNLPKRYAALGQYYAAQENVISIPWADMKAPPLRFGFWRDLLRMLPRNSTLLITCIGSHGRTGTAMAALLLAANPGMTAAKAIKTVKEKHCSAAIETKAQEEYLDRMAKALRRGVARRKKKARRASR